ncbi:MAG: cation transporter [Nitrosopumilus sp. B06]|nr:MAG: cation transporter [Nitrosopumilus sp. B06]
MLEHRTKVLQVSFLAIFSAFIVEIAFGIAEDSLALLTDGIHALLDAIVTLVLLLAARLALKPPDAGHTYGHGKVESLGGMIGGIAIFMIACFFIYESVTRLQSPPTIVPGLLAIVGGIYTIGVDVFRIIILGRSVRKAGGLTVRADFYHALMDLGSTVIAIAGIILVSYGFYQGDFAAALVLGALLVVLSVKLVYRAALDLTDSISPALVASARKAALTTEGVIDVGAVLVRRSGETYFADVTVSLRGDTSFERAHKTSTDVEASIRGAITGSSVTVHFEPDWDGVPLDSRVHEIAADTDGVRGVHNVSTHKTGGRMFADLHVMVDRDADLGTAHRISEAVEGKIHKILNIEHATIHLEPFVNVPETFKIKDAEAEEKIRGMLERRPQVRKIGRIVPLYFGNILKINIDCSFDGSMSIENVHDLTSEIEHEIRTEIRNSVITIHPEPA